MHRSTSPSRTRCVIVHYVILCYTMLYTLLYFCYILTLPLTPNTNTPHSFPPLTLHYSLPTTPQTMTQCTMINEVEVKRQPETDAPNEQSNSYVPPDNSVKSSKFLADQAQVRVYVYIYMCVCEYDYYICRCMCICMCICVYISSSGI
jgi:hypothetical protein